MGAGASAADKAELQQAYAAWEQATAAGQSLTDDDFLKLLERTAPGLHGKASAEGSGPAAAAGLRSQFEMAKRKLQMRALGASSPKSPKYPKSPKSKQTSVEAPAPPPLQKLYSWAPNRQVNLQRGLAAGLLKSEPLRLIDLSVGEVHVAALLDTGAEHCAMSSAGAARCGLQPLVDETFGGSVGGIGIAAKHGRVHYAKVAFKRPVAAQTATSAAAGGGADAVVTAGVAPLFEVAFDVMEWPPHVKFEAIIGIDFLARYKAVVDVGSNALRLVAPTGEKAEAVLLPEA
jgi:hypothetical protein